MKRMFSLLAAALGLAGCGKQFQEATPGSIWFADADVSIDIGAGWLRIDAVPEGMCRPTLAGKVGLIQAYWARTEFTTIDGVMAQAKANAGEAAAEEKAFRSEAGVSGKFISVTQQASKAGEGENRVTTIALPTRSGRLLVLNLIGPDGPMHDSTRETITRTLAYVSK